MVKVKNDLTGKMFGRLLVLEQSDDYISKNGKHYAMWKCECQCDKHTIIYVSGSDLKNGHTKSCGCLNREKIIERNKKLKYNKYKNCGDYFIGYTKKREEFYIDKDDYEICKKYTWWYNKQGYVETKVNQKRVFMHRLLTNCPDDKIVDHINHKPNDNRKLNLRVVTPSQNVMNAKTRCDNKLGIKGIVKRPECNRFEVHIGKDGKDYYLGLYDNIADAIQVRNEADYMLFKDYAYQD